VLIKSTAYLVHSAASMQQGMRIVPMQQQQQQQRHGLAAVSSRQCACGMQTVKVLVM
jgi:hypothetical protein